VGVTLHGKLIDWTSAMQAARVLMKHHIATLAANIEFAQTLALAAMPVNHVTT